MRKNTELYKPHFAFELFTFFYFFLRSLFIQRIWITKSGEPWRFFSQEPTKEPFKPFLQLCEVFRINKDGSMDVRFINTRICLSNGNGMTCRSSFYRLEKNGTIKYWPIYKLRLCHINCHLVDKEIKTRILKGEIDIMEWSHNKPLWNWNNDFEELKTKNMGNII
jgi:hypothetical protein